jgi:hypothetical protein
MVTIKVHAVTSCTVVALLGTRAAAWAAAPRQVSFSRLRPCRPAHKHITTSRLYSGPSASICCLAEPAAYMQYGLAYVTRHGACVPFKRVSSHKTRHVPPQKRQLSRVHAADGVAAAQVEAAAYDAADSLPLDQGGCVVGIDLGTTNSAIAVRRCVTALGKLLVISATPGLPLFDASAADGGGR